MTATAESSPDVLAAALRSIGAGGCERLTRGACYLPNGLDRDEWCDACTANDALLTAFGECQGTGMLPGAAVTVAESENGELYPPRTVTLVCPACERPARAVGLDPLHVAQPSGRVPRHPAVGVSTLDRLNAEGGVA